MNPVNAGKRLWTRKIRDSNQDVIYIHPVISQGNILIGHFGALGTRSDPA
jgi:hypothetical protein